MNDIAALESAFFNEAFTLLRAAGYPILEVDTTAKAPEIVVAEIAAHLGSLR